MTQLTTNLTENRCCENDFDRPDQHELEDSGVSPRRRRRGATAIEYCFLASLIAVVVIAGVQFLGNRTKGLFEKSANRIAETTKTEE